MMASYVGGPQMMYATYHVVPAQNDCQNYYIMVRLCSSNIQLQISGGQNLFNNNPFLEVKMKKESFESN